MILRFSIHLRLCGLVVKAINFKDWVAWVVGMKLKYPIFVPMNQTSATIKTDLLAKALEVLAANLKDIQIQLTELQEASDGEDKNSAGDKYETGMEIINQSRDVLEKQFLTYQKMLNQLKLAPIHAMDRVQEGALIKLPLGFVWVSVPFGKIEVDGVAFQLVSKDSPLIQALWDLKSGETGTFREKKMKVEAVY